ncbi:hypothetical protein WDU94_004013 [Cyamophila willieti]
MTYLFLSVFPVLLVSSSLFSSTYCEGNLNNESVNSTRRFKRKPHFFLSTQPGNLLPDIHVTFPAFDTQVPAVKEIDLSSNSIIRYTPVYDKQPLPTASHQHFERILNKIKNFKRKLKNHRKKFQTTPQYSPVSAEPLAITPIVVPAYDYFPVGPDYLNQYLQISHKYDRQSCIYLKISDDSFMKVQCYPILPHTDQVETYPTSYTNDIFNNPDVSNVYHTLVPNSPLSYPQNMLYSVELSLSTSPSPYENAYYQNAFSQHPSYSRFTPNPRPYHSAPVPTFPHSSVTSIPTYSKPSKVFHYNKTSLPSSLTFPSTNGHHGNSTDKLLTTLSNTNGSPYSGTGFPVDNKSEMTPNNVPTRISLLNHAIAPLDIEPTQISNTDKMFFHSVDTIVVEASTEKLSTTSTEINIHVTLPNEVDTLPALGLMEIIDSLPQLPSYSKEFENVAPKTSITESSSSDKAFVETTDSDRGTHPPVISSKTTGYTELTIEPLHTTLAGKISESEDRVFEPDEEIGSVNKVQSFTTIPGSVMTKQKETTTQIDRTQWYGTSSEFHETTHTENDLKIYLTTDSYDTAFSTDGFSDILKELITTTGTFDKDVTITTESSPYDLKQFPTTTTETYDKDEATTTSSPSDDLKQLPTTTTETYDKYEATTISSPSDDLRQFPTTRTETYEKDVATTTSSPSDDLKQLPTTTTETYDKYEATTTSSPSDDLRQLPTTTTETYDKDVATTTSSPSDDLRQLPTTTIETYDKDVATTTSSPSDDLRQLPTATTETYDKDVATTTSSPSDDLRQLPTTTTETYDKDVATTTSSPSDDLRQLPTTTTETYDKDVATTTSSPSDDLRQLPTTTTETYDKDVATTTSSPSDDLRQLPTTTTETYDKDEATTTSNPSDDLRQLLTTTTETYDKDVASVTTSSSNDMRQLTPTTIDPYDVAVTIENSPNDLRSDTMSTVETFEETWTISTQRKEDSLNTEDLRQLPESSTIYNPPTSNIEDSSLTTDDKITWFTSDIDDASPRGTLPTLSLIRSDVPEASTTTVSITTLADRRKPTEKEDITTPNVHHLGLPTEKSIEDNEIIPHQPFTKNVNERMKSLLNNEVLNKVISPDSSDGKKNENIYEETNTSMKSKIDKNSILTLSSEDIKQDNERKIPLETNGGNIVKVLEKNVNTGIWEVQFYKVGANNTSLNSEDIDMPRRSDVLISDYDGYDNIDSDAEEQYEYDYHTRNSSSHEAKLAFSNLGRTSLLNDERSKPSENMETPNETHSGRTKRHDSISVEKLEQLNSSYEKMKENNSSVLSEIKDITRNNTENSNSTNLNVNYLDDFLKLRDQVKQYFDEKKEIKRTKRSVTNAREREDSLYLQNKLKKNLNEARLSPGNKRQGSINFYEVNVKRTERRKRNKRAMTNIIDNSTDIDNENNTTENIKTNTSMKHSLVPELLKNSNSTDSPHSSSLPELKNMLGNNGDAFSNFPGLASNKNSKFLNIKTTPNYTIIKSQNEKSRFKNFNSTVFNLERKIETTTELRKEDFNVSVSGNNTNSTYIYKHKNLSYVEQNDLYASPVPVISPNVSFPVNLPAPVDQTDGRNVLGQGNVNPTVSSKSNGNGTSIREKYVNFFRNLKDALNSTLIKNPVKSSGINISNSIQPKDSSTNNVDYFNIKPGYNGNLSPNTAFVDKTQHTINFIKNITKTLLLKQNVTGQDNGSLHGEVKQLTQPINRSSYELKLTIGKTVNTTTSSDGSFVPMYVEMLLVVQITLLLALLAFFAFLHYADSRLNKRRQFDTSVTFLNNAFESERVFNDLP